MASQVPRSLEEPWRDLRGKVVMVTGASAGLGSDFCLDLAKAGCSVIAAARRIDHLKSLCGEINQLVAVAVELDVSVDGAPIEASVQRAWDAFGRIDASSSSTPSDAPPEKEIASKPESKFDRNQKGEEHRVGGVNIHYNGCNIHMLQPTV